MNKVKFQKNNSNNIEIGQVRINDHNEIVLVIESETGIYGMTVECFNVIHLNGQPIYRTLYKNAVDKHRVVRDFPELVDVKDITITTFNKEVVEVE